MKNLTQTDKTGKWTLGGIPWAELSEDTVLTKESSQKIYGALCKLHEYEKTGLTPQEAADVNDFNKTSTARLPEKPGRAENRFRWIPAAERLPEDSTELVLAQVNGWPDKHIHLENAFLLAYYSRKEGWILEEYPEWDAAEVAAWFPLPDIYVPEPKRKEAENA